MLPARNETVLLTLEDTVSRIAFHARWIDLANEIAIEKLSAGTAVLINEMRLWIAVLEAIAIATSTNGRDALRLRISVDAKGFVITLPLKDTRGMKVGDVRVAIGAASWSAQSHLWPGTFAPKTHLVGNVEVRLRSPMHGKSVRNVPTQRSEVRPGASGRRHLQLRLRVASRQDRLSRIRRGLLPRLVV